MDEDRKKLSSIQDLLKDLNLDKRRKYLKEEYQAYGLQLAREMDEWDKRAMYIRLAKQTDRKLLEKARLFIKDQTKGSIKTPGKLFLWKLKQLKDEANSREIQNENKKQPKEKSKS
jgi:hypothetical protein